MDGIGVEDEVEVALSQPKLARARQEVNLKEAKCCRAAGSVTCEDACRDVPYVVAGMTIDRQIAGEARLGPDSR